MEKHWENNTDATNTEKESPTMHQIDILLVDDDATIRELLTILLQEAGYTVTAVADAVDACTCLASSSFQLLLTDHFMPNMLGAELVTRVREQHPELHTILMSSNPHIEFIARVIGADGWWAKSPGIVNLFQQIHQVLNGGKTESI